MLKLYNTLTKTVEEIENKDHLNLYTCGPTVYNYVHIGNLRSFVEADFLYRTLKSEGYNPRWVMNITDIDDKTIKGTIEKFGPAANVTNLKDFTSFYSQEFFKNLREVNVPVDEIRFINVTDVIPQIQQFIVDLIDRDYAYKAEDGVYFNIEKYQKDFDDYGVLVGEKFLEGKKVGARVAVDEYEKDNLSDFALWKTWDEKTDGQIFWDHPVLGKGRPGWHIECSAINQLAFEGETTDIHTGGVDLIFPHHTNEIAQSQALLGKGNFVKHWFHSEHLLVNNKKMAKRDNNFYVLSDLKDKAPLAELSLRYLFTQSSYRGQQNFTLEGLLSAYRTIQKLFNTVKANKIIGEHQEFQQQIFNDYLNLENSLDHDLNLPNLSALLSQVISDKTVNIHTQHEIIKKYDEILGLNILNPPSILENLEVPESIQNLLNQRQQAKSEKDFSKADELRAKIEKEGYEVMDTADGQKVKKKISV